MRYANITYPDINNGPGFRISIFFQGCSLRCKGCFNSEIWNFKGGKEFTDETKELIYSLLDKPYIEGITLLGGEPFDQPSKELFSFIKNIKDKFPNKTIWAYTGYTFEYLQENIFKFYPFTNYIDTIVDGQFIEELKDPSLDFRGSSNQRIITLHV